jgi:dGTPase
MIPCSDELDLRLPHGIAVAGGKNDTLTRRVNPERPHPYRSPFMRDIGRVLHARAFRRMAGKTQVFTRMPDAPPADHFRSRLTHTLEVAQIARTAAAALCLNSELAECLALVHDIGHPPFGHAGEKALDRALRAYSLSFDHNLHALRIVTWFEERYPPFRGLNLTLAVREGIIKHSRDYSEATHPELAEYFLDQFPPLEAQLIDLADEIAYLTADLDDGLSSGILVIDEVRKSVPLFSVLHDEALRNWPNASPRMAINHALRRLLDAFVTDLLNAVHARVLSLKATTLDDIRRASSRLVALSDEMETIRDTTKKFLYARLYNSPGMEETHEYAENVVEGLFEVLIADPTLMPEDHQAEIPGQGLARTVADYIAGMTDSYIQEVWSRHAPRFLAG